MSNHGIEPHPPTKPLRTSWNRTSTSLVGGRVQIRQRGRRLVLPLNLYHAATHRQNGGSFYLSACTLPFALCLRVLLTNTTGDCQGCDPYDPVIKTGNNRHVCWCWLRYPAHPLMPYTVANSIRAGTSVARHPASPPLLLGYGKIFAVIGVYQICAD